MKLPCDFSSPCPADSFTRLRLGLATLALVLGVAPAVRAELPIPYPDPGTINPVTYTFTAMSTGEIDAYYAIPHTTASFTETVGLIGQRGFDGTDSSRQPNFPPRRGLRPRSVHAGDTLTFVLNVVSEGYTLYSNPAMNSDGTNHVYSTQYDALNASSGDAKYFAGAGIPYGTYVAFEDELNGNSDFNYHDDAFVFTNTAVTSTPEPSSALIVVVVGGLAGVAVNRRRKAATRPANA